MARKPPKESEEADLVQRYLDALQARPAGDHVLFGMVKPTEGGDGLLFAHAGHCGPWIHIPRSAIDTITPAGRVRCRSHLHDTAEIALRQPETALEKTFADVAGLHRARLDQLLASDDDHHCGPNQHWGQDQYGNWGCQPGR